MINIFSPVESRPMRAEIQAFPCLTPVRTSATPILSKLAEQIEHFGGDMLVERALVGGAQGLADLRRRTALLPPRRRRAVCGVGIFFDLAPPLTLSVV